MERTSATDVIESRGSYAYFLQALHTRHELIAPALVGLVSFLYFFYSNPHEALLFATVGFTCIAITTQFLRVGVAVSFAVQAVLFSYLVFIEDVPQTQQIFFSVVAVASSVIALLSAEEVEEKAARVNPQVLLQRVEDQQKRADQFYIELQSVVERTTKVVEQREALILERTKLQEMLAKLSHEKSQLEVEIVSQKNVSDSLQARLGDVEGREQVLKERLELLLQQSIKYEELKTTMIESKKELELLEKENEELVSLIEEARTREAAIEQSRVEEKLQERISLQVHSEGVERSDTKLPAEAKYLQLREQFEAKSHVLDETRKQLFYTQEKLSAMEKQLSEPSEDCIRMTKEIALLEDCMKQMDILYKKEIETYEKLVATLFQQISASSP